MTKIVFVFFLMFAHFLFCVSETSDFVVTSFDIDYNDLENGQDGFLLPKENYDTDKLLKKIIKSSQYFLSAMVYGFNFEMNFENKQHGFKKKFKLSLNYLIPYGSKRYKVLKVSQDKKGVHMDVIFYLNEFEQKIKNRWNLSKIDKAGIVSGYPICSSSDSKSLKKAVEVFLIKKQNSKPNIKSVQGEGVLVISPKFWVKNGQLFCNSSFKVKINSYIKVVSI